MSGSVMSSKFGSLVDLAVFINSRITCAIPSGPFESTISSMSRQDSSRQLFRCRDKTLQLSVLFPLLCTHRYECCFHTLHIMGKCHFLSCVCV